MSTPSLARRLGLGDAVFIGLGSMIGAGVFSAFAPAAAAAGSGLLIGLAIAAVVAFGNATSSAQLAAAHPTSGGTYAYGRAELGPWWGFVAGWGFVVGKLASCAAMALTFAAYAAPPGWERPVAILAVAALATVNWFGVTRTAQLTRVIVVVALLSLAVAVAAGASAPDAPGWLDADALWTGGWYGILQAGGLLFFAFAGLRAHRDDGRGGARSREDDPPRHRARVRGGGGRLRRGRRGGAVDPRPGRDGGLDRAGRGRGRRGGLGLGGARHPDRRGCGIPRRPARPDRGHRPHHVRDGARGRPPPVPVGRPPALAGAAPRRGRVGGHRHRESWRSPTSAARSASRRSACCCTT